ncbi:MAG: Pre-rRNA-processing ipi1 [Lasallia pustulata]|uniref:Pre-rRNA-processing protein n=1 Tax=Lasallia pustulata TaxID=136370 RepID=A0A5M8PW16_9LECA|nr:MAG: Pre-rRNA-processing ipi1 [Lasallia pustulata]
MGSSAKKKKDKKKDFQKPKLKVGKARPKASNFTDTSFKSKAIVVNQQSLTPAAPSLSSQFSHHLSLLTSRSDSQRRDSLSYLTTAVAARPVNAPLQQPVSVILPSLLPLLLDGNNNVRTQLLKLLRSLPPRDVEDHVSQLLLYIRAGMTHLAADIRSSSIDVLGWLLELAGPELVSCAGGWMKTLKCFLAMLGWPNEVTAGAWSTSKASFGKGGSEGKIMVKNLNTLASFLRAGLVPVNESQDPPFVSKFPLWHVQHQLLPKVSNCYAHLNLFGPPRDEESEIYEDREARQRIFHVRFQCAIEAALEAAKREGGEVGRAAAAVKKTLVEGMDGFEQEEDF